MADQPEDEQSQPVAKNRSARAQIAFDEGRASARGGHRSALNPFLPDLETEQHLAWQEGHGSHEEP